MGADNFRYDNFTVKHSRFGHFRRNWLKVGSKIGLRTRWCAQKQSQTGFAHPAAQNSEPSLSLRGREGSEFYTAGCADQSADLSVRTAGCTDLFWTLCLPYFVESAKTYLTP